MLKYLVVFVVVTQKSSFSLNGHKEKKFFFILNRITEILINFIFLKSSPFIYQKNLKNQKKIFLFFFFCSAKNGEICFFLTIFFKFS
jgi:hypothetical protein